MSNNNNNSDRIYIILGVLGFLCVMSSCAALLIRHITKSDPSKKSPTPSPSPAPSPAPASLKGTLEHWTPYSINHRHNIYMERQHVDCQDHAMRGFLLRSNWDCDGDTTCKSQVSEADRTTTHAQAVKVNDKSTAIRYHYKCDVNKQSNVTDKNTDWVSNPDLDVTYAYGKSDNLTVDCDNKPITYYELQTDSGRDWDLRYFYKCGSTTSDKCRDITTNETVASDNPGYLDRQDVTCKENEYMSKFKLINSDDNLQYKYKCCEIPGL